MTFPVYEFVKTVHLGGFIERIESLMVGIWVTTVGLKVMVLFYGAVTALAETLSLKDYRPLVLPGGVLLVALSILIFPDVNAIREFLAHTWPALSLTVSMGILVLLWVVSLVRKKGNDRQGRDRMRMAAGLKINGAVLIALLFVAAVCSSGCWDRHEIESLAFINAVGVDQAGNGNVLVTFYVVNPDALGKKGGGGSSPPAYSTSVEARDVAQALARYAEESPRLPRFKQLQAIIIGEDLARQGVGPVLDFFSRHWEMRRSIWVLVAKGKAQDILTKGQPPLEKLLAPGSRASWSGGIHLTATRYPVVLGDFLTDISRPGMEPIASSIELYPMQEATAGGPRAGKGRARLRPGSPRLRGSKLRRGAEQGDCL